MRRQLSIFTIVLDGMPWIACVYAELMKLHGVPWQWTIVEGAAMNVKDTAWMRRQPARLSADGTSQFLDTISLNPNITVIRNPKWEGKAAMCNAALDTFKNPGVLMQIDSDELWNAEQLRTIFELFEDDSTLGKCAFSCRYFVGPNIRTTDDVDWWRAWRYLPGDKFVTHEPPVMFVGRGRAESRQCTAQLGLVFDHPSWLLPKHVAQKEELYGARYKGALEGWRRLQVNEKFPIKLKEFFPWTQEHVLVDRVFPKRE